MLYRAGRLADSESGPSATWEGKRSPFRVLTGVWSGLGLVPSLSILIGIIVGTSSLGPTMSNAEDPFAAPGPSNANHQLAEKKMLSVYVSLGREHKLVHYHLEPQSGQLTRRSELEVPGTPGAQVSSSDRHRLYVSMRSIKSVSTLQIEPRTGDLTLLSTTLVAENPVYLALDPAGRHVLMSSYNGNLAAIYPVKDDGSIDSTATTIFETEQNPHSIMLDPSGRYGYIPNTGSDSIWQLRYDHETGLLTPNEPDRVPTEAGAGPRHFYFHPRLSVVYFVNEKNSSVTAYRLQPTTGTLEALQTVSTLPNSFQDRDNNTCADIEVTPCGRFLYASNRGHDSLAGYAIDPESGRLTILGNFPTEQTPRSFNIAPGGNFLIAAGQGNGRLACYRIPSDTGRLELLETHDVGADPAWVQIVRRPE